MNPFKKSPCAIDSLEDWIGRKDAVEKLEACIRTRENTVILGVEGAGKSSLLKSYFSYSYRKKQAVGESRKLIFFVDLTNTSGGGELCDYLFSQLVNAVKMLLIGTELKKDMLEYLADVKADRDSTPKSRFEAAVQGLNDIGGYYVVLLIDGFERFTSSLTITYEHHDMLRSLIEANLLQCIVATNYDLNKDSLPPDVEGSMYLQKFQNKVIVRGFTLEDAVAFVDRKLQGDEIQFSREYTARLYDLSGGVPAVFELAASYAYENICKNNGKLKPKEIGAAIYDAVQPTMRRWCKLLTPSQMKAVAHLLEDQAEMDISGRRTFYFQSMDAEIQGAVSNLCDRGILIKTYETDENGWTYERMGYYSLNSLLLQQFGLKGDMNRMAQENPLLSAKNKKAQQAQREEEEHLYKKRMQDLETEREQAIIDAYHRGGPANYYISGDYNDNRGADNRQINIHAEGANIVSASQFLSLLGLGDTEQSGNLLLERVQSVSGKLRDSRQALPAGETLEIVDAESDEAIQERDRQIDEELAEISAQMLPDVDPETLEDADLDTFDLRFQRVRAKLNLENQLNDQLLSALSPLCCFYVKAAVVVEDHMSAIVGLLGHDYSTHLVMYGKCLEQSLRDTLFPLFSTHDDFRHYNTHSHHDTPGAQDTFGMMPNETKAMLGAFFHMLKERKERLATLCLQNSITVPTVVDSAMNAGQWTSWWHRFAQKVNRAKDIRNKVHAGGPAPTETDLQNLRSYTFGMDGILYLSQVGRALNFKLNQPQARMLTDAETKSLVNTVQQLHCESLSDKNALDGVLDIDLPDCKVNGHMAKKLVRSITEDPNSLLGTTISVKLTQFDKQNNWFVVTPV